MYNHLTTKHMDVLAYSSSHPSSLDAERSFTNDISVKKASGELDREECFQIRRFVFVSELGVPYECEQDQFDAIAMHYLAIYHGRPIATVRLVDKGDGVGKIGKLAVLREYRKYGIGTDLMWYVMGIGFRNFHTLVIDSPIERIQFFETLGFETDGEMALVFGVWHTRMYVRR